MSFKEQLIALSACNAAIKWAADKSLQEAWETCHRGDWMLWLYRRARNYNLQKLILAKGHCANTVRHLMKDERSRKAVDVAIAFGEGNASRKEFDAAYAIAYAGYVAVVVHHAGYAAVVVHYAANAAYYAADAYADDAYAADYAAAAAYAAYYDADAARTAKETNQKATADICRKYLPMPEL